MSLVLNDSYNEWYRIQLRNYIISNDVKNYPEKIKGFKFDLNQQKINTIQITDEELAIANVPGRKQKTADIHCIAPRTVTNNKNKVY